MILILETSQRIDTVLPLNCLFYNLLQIELASLIFPTRVDKI